MDVESRGAVFSLALAGLAVFALSGCTSDGPQAADPAPSASGSASASGVPSPTRSAPVKPVRPAEMDLADERGAEAAARYFFELYPYVLESGDTADWDAMSAVTCEFCASITQSDGSEGTLSSGGHVILSDLSVGYDDLLGGYPVEADYTQEPATWVSPDGAVSSESGESGHMQIDVMRADRGWQIVGVAHGAGE